MDMKLELVPIPVTDVDRAVGGLGVADEHESLRHPPSLHPADSFLNPPVDKWQVARPICSQPNG